MDEQQGEPEGLRAELKRHVEFAGSGCLLQGVAILLPFIGAMFGPVGVIAGLAGAVVLFVMGSNSATRWRCSSCRNFVSDKSVRVCPACRASFGGKQEQKKDDREYYV